MWRGYVPEQLGWQTGRGYGLDWCACAVYFARSCYLIFAVASQRENAGVRGPLMKIIYSGIQSPVPLAVVFFNRRTPVAVRRAWALHVVPASPRHPSPPPGSVSRHLFLF